MRTIINVTKKVCLLHFGGGRKNARDDETKILHIKLEQTCFYTNNFKSKWNEIKLWHQGEKKLFHLLNDYKHWTTTFYIFFRKYDCACPSTQYYGFVDSLRLNILRSVRLFKYLKEVSNAQNITKTNQNNTNNTNNKNKKNWTKPK